MAGEKKKILVVDDDEIQLVLVKSILDTEYEVITASSGKEALDYLIYKYVPNLILLDILMPNMDGWEAYNRLKAIGCLENVPIAFLTSLSEPRERKQALEMGAADYILKPYRHDELMNRVRIILKKHEQAAASDSPQDTPA